MSGAHQIINLFEGLCLDVEFCPETGYSYIVVIKLWSKNSTEGILIIFVRNAHILFGNKKLRKQPLLLGHFPLLLGHDIVVQILGFYE